MQIDLKEFHSWTKTKSGEYDYFDNHGCPLAQFLKESTGREVNVGGASYRFYDDEETDYDISDEISDALQTCPHTFPTLTQRLEALL